MTSNRLPNGQQIGLLELQVLGVIGRHWASPEPVRRRLYAQSYGRPASGAMWPIAAHVNEGGQSR
jgi:hypothetical protein